MKNIITALLTAITLFSCNGAYALEISPSTIVTVCKSAARLAVIGAKMQNANNESILKGESPKYDKQSAIARSASASDIPALSKAYSDATEYGFNNTDVDYRTLYGLAYDNCRLHFTINPNY